MGYFAVNLNDDDQQGTVLAFAAIYGLKAVPVCGAWLTGGRDIQDMLCPASDAGHQHDANEETAPQLNAALRREIVEYLKHGITRSKRWVRRCEAV